MAERSDSQRIGSTGHKLVALLIEKAGGWVARSQDEDFGIDLEAEVADPKLRGEILKIQIKGKEAPEITTQAVKVILETKYLRLAEGLRVPLVLIVADTTSDRAWYLWLQGWLVDQRRVGKMIDSYADSVTVYIPVAHTLTDGLKGPLMQVARWSHENQLVLSLVDTLRTAVATQNQKVLFALADLIGSVEEAYKDFPLELLIDTIVRMNEQPRMMWEMSIFGHFLGLLCRKLGGHLSKANLIRMVIHADGWSRAGMVGLGALYDEYEDLIRSFNLPAAFEAAGHPDVAFYCRLREKYPGVKAIQLAFGEYDYTIGNMRVEMEDKGWFTNKWANRGESIYLDCVHIIDVTNSTTGSYDD